MRPKRRHELTSNSPTISKDKPHLMTILLGSRLESGNAPKILLQIVHTKSRKNIRLLTRIAKIGSKTESNKLP